MTPPQYFDLFVQRAGCVQRATIISCYECQTANSRIWIIMAVKKEAQLFRSEVICIYERINIAYQFVNIALISEKKGSEPKIHSGLGPKTWAIMFVCFCSGFWQCN